MSDLLNIGRSGLLTFQGRMAITNRNITNVNDLSYHKENSDLSPERQNSVSVLYKTDPSGNGVYSSQAYRIYSEFVETEKREAFSHFTQLETITGSLNNMDEIYSNLAVRMIDSIDKVIENVNHVDNMPTDLGLRSSLLSSAHVMTQDFHRMHQQITQELERIDVTLNKRLQNFNSLLNEVLTINEYILTSDFDTPKLFDRRDDLINRLSSYADVSVIPQSDKTLLMLIGNSVTVAAKTEVAQLKLIPGELEPEKTDLGVEFTDQVKRFDPMMLGGSIQALFEYRDHVLRPALDHLDVYALQVAAQMNHTQESGFNLHGNVASRMFTDINDPALMPFRSFADEQNEGTATIEQVILSDIPDVYESDQDQASVTDIVGDEYIVEVLQAPEVTKTTADGLWPAATDDVASGVFKITNIRSEDSQEFTFPPETMEYQEVVGQPIFGDSTFEGINIVFEDATDFQIKDDDKFLLRPFAKMATNFFVEMDDPTQVAAAQGVQYSFESSIKPEAVARGDDPHIRVLNIERDNLLLNEYITEGSTLEFSYGNNATVSPNHYLTAEIFDADGNLVQNTTGSNPLFPIIDLGIPRGDDISTLRVPYKFHYLGTQFELDSSDLLEGDKFSFQIDFGEGDNRNMLAMADIMTKATIQHLPEDEARFSFKTFLDAHQTFIGTQDQAATLQFESAKFRFEFAEKRALNLSGVNLDEEAADLVKFQQGYQASAQIIVTASTIIQSLLQAMS